VSQNNIFISHLTITYHVHVFFAKKSGCLSLLGKVPTLTAVKLSTGIAVFQSNGKFFFYLGTFKYHMTVF